LRYFVLVDPFGSDVDEVPSRAAAMAMKYCRSNLLGFRFKGVAKVCFEVALRITQRLHPSSRSRDAFL
jgi:hypothetical protein